MIGWAEIAMIGGVSVLPLMSLASALLNVPIPERALVIGSAQGEPVFLLAREFPSARIRGLDPSLARVREATSRVGLDPEGRVAFKTGKPSALPYPDGFFDLVVLCEGRLAPGELDRVLRPGGHLILAPLPGGRPARRLRQRILEARLARRGFTGVPAGSEAVGNFYIARLDDRD